MEKNKIIILGDIHIGCRNESIEFTDNLELFLEKTFFPYLEEHGIKHILQLGDIFNSRQYSDNLIFSRFKKTFLDVIEARDIKLYIILGNHDIYSKTSLHPNACDLYLGKYNNITVIDKPRVENIGGHKIACCPWICADNEEECLRFIASHQADYIAGHFELNNFLVVPGQEFSGSKLNAGSFQAYKEMWSGHFHLRQSRGNINYIGSCREITWSDYANHKGFDVWDGTTREFIENPHKMFEVISYDDRKQNYHLLDLSKYEGKNVKVKVVHKSDAFQLDTLSDKLNRITRKCSVLLDTPVAPLITDESSKEQLSQMLGIDEMIRQYVAKYPFENQEHRESTLELLMHSLTLAKTSSTSND